MRRLLLLGAIFLGLGASAQASVSHGRDGPSYTFAPGAPFTLQLAHRSAAAFERLMLGRVPNLRIDRCRWAKRGLRPVVDCHMVLSSVVIVNGMDPVGYTWIDRVGYDGACSYDWCFRGLAVQPIGLRQIPPS